MPSLRHHPDKYLAPAEAAMERKDWAAAAAAWQRAIKKLKRRTPPQVYRKLAQAYRQQEDYDAAELATEQGLRRHPDSLPLLIAHADVANQRDDRPAATTRYKLITDRFAEQAPPKAWLKLARLHRLENMLDVAERVVNTGLKAYPDNLDLMTEPAAIATAQANWAAAVQRWQMVVNSMPDAPEAAQAGLVQALRLSRKLDAAEAAVKTARKHYPDNLALKVEQAEIATHQKDWPAALRSWKAVLKAADPKIPAGQDAYHRARFNISLLERLTHVADYKKLIKKYQDGRQHRDAKTPKIAIVTAYTKGYDSLKPPAVLDPAFDYIAFTDSGEEGMGVYDVRPLPNQRYDGPRAIRYVKILPHRLFADYDVVVWLDTSLMIVGDLMPLIKKFLASKLPIGSNAHSQRKNVYEEFAANVERKKDDYETLQKQIDFYREQGFEHNDLAENGFLMFNIKHPDLAAPLETWWEQLNNFSRRDQLSFNYSLAQHGVKWHRIGQPPHSIRSHPELVIAPHHADSFALTELRRQL